ncbi:MAG: DUF4383 domain-containing protein [Ktedonobacterales bacterium]|nr:DUF4383 domain-containing protein [Ktedonobacterales bacterium]
MNYPRLSAFILAFIIVVVGILGFFDYFAPEGVLFGLFQVNTIHNLIHIITGLIGLIAVIPNHRRYAAWYILEMGVIYALVTILGFVYNGDIFDLAYFNLNDNLLHAGITILSFGMSILILLDRPQEYTGISLREDPQRMSYR